MYAQAQELTTPRACRVATECTTTKHHAFPLARVQPSHMGSFEQGLADAGAFFDSPDEGKGKGGKGKSGAEFESEIAPGQGKGASTGMDASQGKGLSALSRFQASMELHNGLPLYLTYLGLRPGDDPAAQHGI